MIYRIHEDDRYLGFSFDADDIIDKLGRKYPIHIKRAPISYSEVWPESLRVEFKPWETYSKDIVPDVSLGNGRLFLNEKAYDALKDVLNDYGEFLAVHHDKGEGYVFNPLVTAESVNGVDDKQTVHDKHGNLESYAFIEESVKDIAIFRTELDVYLSVYCNQVFKDTFEKAGLIGISFNKDVSNALIEMYGVEFPE